jgi:outer membrane murein-binding lipoprotein Lpp
LIKFLLILAPKRVLNVLRSILNYNAYVQHTYNATIQKAKERLKERDELLMIRNQLRSEIESEKIKEGNISSHIKELEAKIPQQKTKIADLQEKEKALKSEINRNNEEREKCETKVSELISHLEELKASTISDEEVKSIEIAQQQIEEQRREQHEISNSARQKLVEDTCNIEKTTTLIKNLESILPNDRVDVKSFKTLNEEIQDLKSEINLLHQNHAKVQAELTSIKQHAKTKNKLYEDESKQLDEKQNHFKTILTQQKKEIKDKKNELKKLKTISANQRLTNARLRKEQTTLYQINQDLIKHISNQSKFTK